MKTRLPYRIIVFFFIVLLASNQALAEKYIGVDGPATQIWWGAPVDIGAENITHWAGLNISWWLNSNGAGDGLTFSQTQSAVQDGFSSWQNLSTADISFSYSGSTSSTWSYEGRNVHYWAESGDPIFNYLSGFLAVTVITINGSEEFLDVDIVFNGRDYTWRTNGSDYDIEAISAHEIGHMIGLHHTEVTSPPLPTMYAYYQGIDGRSLEWDDQVGASFLYRGNLIDNETFSGINYFYWRLTIYSGKALTISPGTALNFAPGTSLTVYGTLNADSNDPTKRIIFTSTSPTSGSWSGIKINSGSSTNVSTLRRCDVKYATDGITITYTGNSNNVTIDKCRISNNSRSGIYVNGNAYSGASTHPTISNNHIQSNGYFAGIYLENYAKPLITGNRIESNYWNGIYGTSSASATVEFNYVKGTAYGFGFGIRFENSSLAQIHRNTVTLNSAGSGGIYLASSSNAVAYGAGDTKGRNKITSNAGDGILSQDSAPIFGKDVTNEWGNNQIQDNSGFQASESGWLLRAEQCYWAGQHNDISGNVDNVPYLTSVPSPVGWGQGDSYDPSSRIAPATDDRHPIVVLTKGAVVQNTFDPVKWSESFLAAMNAGLGTGDWTDAAEIITQLWRELQDGRVPTLDYTLLASYAENSTVESSVRKYLALALVERHLAERDISKALQGLQQYQASNPKYRAELLANLGIIRLHRMNDLAGAEEVLAQLRALAAQNNRVAIANERSLSMMIESYRQRTSSPSLPRLADRSSVSTPDNTISLQLGNFPNPFNPSTMVRFTIPRDGVVSLKVFDILGREVATLVNQHYLAGSYQVMFNASSLSSGVYLYKLETHGKTAIQKMIIVR